LDNSATHRYPKAKAAHSPSAIASTFAHYSSWLNQIERWFALITQQTIRRGSLRYVWELVAKIDASVGHYNATSGLSS
jgi:hypothetical protein